MENKTGWIRKQSTTTLIWFCCTVFIHYVYFIKQKYDTINLYFIVKHVRSPWGPMHEEKIPENTPQ